MERLGWAIVAFVPCIVWVCGCNTGGDDDDAGDDDSGGPACGSLADVASDAWVQVEAGDHFTLGLLGDGTWHEWGECYDCDPEPGAYVDVAAGWASFGCAIRDDCTLSCFGSDSHQEETAPPDGTFIDVAAGDQHLCALHSDGSVACWGSDPFDYGVLLAPQDEAFVSLGLGYATSCGLDAGGALVCWGAAESTVSNPPADAFAQFDLGNYHGCGVRHDGTVACWGCESGSHDYGQCEEPAGQFQQVSAGTIHTCGITTAGIVECWGDNTAKQCEAPAGEFVQVTSGQSHSCAITADGELLCWGCDPEDTGMPSTTDRGQCDVPDI
jgi:alpha-tubulin suppressor-like RCC1 family protein